MGRAWEGAPRGHGRAGLAELNVPRGRVHQPDGTTTEFQSTILPRYARGTRKVNEAILGAYLSGTDTRRIKKALTPLLGEANSSKSAVSRVVSHLKALFARWAERDLSGESYPILYLDAINVMVRLARRVVSLPLLIVFGIAEEGQKRVVDLRPAVSESGTTWGGLVGGLGRRGLPEPQLVVSDEHAGLKKAMELWDEARVQRCAVPGSQAPESPPRALPKARAPGAQVRPRSDRLRQGRHRCAQGLRRVPASGRASVRRSRAASRSQAINC